jgi:hypothetical protein
MSSPAVTPDVLRPALIKQIENLDESDLATVQRVLQLLEKERLWSELSDAAEQDRLSGKFDRLPEIIREVRAARQRG